ncbi:MAG: hypothetical protein IJT54_01850 [Candidatus Methanomethylophilaceae archaeon]|nr:hypothetical protein [Candidatus Methanomethylophilaceae archaeon]
MTFVVTLSTQGGITFRNFFKRESDATRFSEMVKRCMVEGRVLDVQPRSCVKQCVHGRSISSMTVSVEV